MDTPDQLQMQGIDPLDGKRFLVRKRDGRIEEFNEARILLAIESAFKAHYGIRADQPLPEILLSAAKTNADRITERVVGRAVRGEEMEVERIQDTVEDQLMRAGQFDIARRYILYREQRRQARAEREGRSRPWIADVEPISVPSLGGPNLRDLYRQTFPKPRAGETVAELTCRYFDCYLNEAEYFQLLTPALLDFDIAALAGRLRSERDGQFSNDGLAALQERYLARQNGRFLETPQYFWMRIAMGLAQNERTPEARAAEFYEALSTFRFIPEDDILLRTGTINTRLSGPAESGEGWRELWDRDLFDYLRSDTSGQKGVWVPDLFLKRLSVEDSWTLLDSAEAADLRDSHGEQFEARYSQYEQSAQSLELRFARSIPTAVLWKQLLSGAATGRLTLAFKDAIRTSARSIRAAVPAGAINLAAHVAADGSGLDLSLLRQTITTAVRMLDNAVDLDMSTEPGREGRGIALGLAGLPEAMSRFCVAALKRNASHWTGKSMELVAHHATLASAELAAERGAFVGYAGSKWSDGILPLDNLAMRPSLPWDNIRETIRRHGIRNESLAGSALEAGPTRLAGLAVLPAVAQSVDYVASLQKWTHLVWPLVLPAVEGERTSAACLEAWSKGILIIELTGASGFSPKNSLVLSGATG